MSISKILILVSASPHTHQAKLALADAKARLSQGETVSVFFYGDGAYTANRLMWQTADVPSISDGQGLYRSNISRIYRCVSAQHSLGASPMVKMPNATD